MLPIKRPWKSNYCRTWREQIALNYSGRDTMKNKKFRYISIMIATLCNQEGIAFDCIHQTVAAVYSARPETG